MLHQSEYLYKKFFKNPYVRVFVGGCIIIVLTLLVGNQNYNGTGIQIIAQCIDGTVRPEAFFLKMVFTALTLGAGYKGSRHDSGLLRCYKLSDHFSSDQL